MTCDFCDELKNIETIYNKIYGEKNRLIYSSEHFTVFPCMGQLREGHLLIASKDHINAIGMLNAETIEELKRLILKVGEFFRTEYGKDLLCFEHGVLGDDGTNGGCGIFHTHIHLLPADDLELNATMEHIKSQETNQIVSVQGVEDTRHFVASQKTYLYISFVSNVKDVKAYIVSNSQNYFPSQYLRKIICEVSGKSEWDWRKITWAEPEFIITLEKCRTFFAYPNCMMPGSKACF